MNTRRGFTLIELLILLAIIGIVAAAVLPIVFPKTEVKTRAHQPDDKSTGNPVKPASSP